MLMRSDLAPGFSYDARDLIQRYITACPLSCQFRQLLTTTVTVGFWRHNPPSLQDASAFLERTLNDEQLILTWPIGMDPANSFSDWLDLRLGARNYLIEFSRLNPNRAYYLAYGWE